MSVETKKNRVKCAIDNCDVEIVGSSAADLLQHLFIEHVDDSNLNAIICAHSNCNYKHKYVDSIVRSHMKREHGNTSSYIDNRPTYRKTVINLVRQYHPHLLDRCKNIFDRWELANLSTTTAINSTSIGTNPHHRINRSRSPTVSIVKQQQQQQQHRRSSPKANHNEATAIAVDNVASSSARTNSNRQLPLLNDVTTSTKMTAAIVVKCKLCNVMIDVESKTEHFFKEHCKDYRYSCPYCTNVNRLSIRAIYIHINVAHPGNQHQCNDNLAKYQQQIDHLFIEHNSVNSHPIDASMNIDRKANIAQSSMMHNQMNESRMTIVMMPMMLPTSVAQRIEAMTNITSAGRNYSFNLQGTN